MSGDRLTGNGPEFEEESVTPLSTARGGKPGENVDGRAVQLDDSGEPSTEFAEQPVDNSESVDLTRSALADAQTLARSRPGARGRGRDARRQTRADNLAGRPGGYSGPGPDPARDPQPLGQVLAGYVQDRGWERPLAEGRLFTEWRELVGADVAAHCQPQSLLNGELRIAAESTAWATQLRLLSATVLARLVAELGPQVVTKLHITGPVAPSWKHGSRSVRGARGPRDTYG